MVRNQILASLVGIKAMTKAPFKLLAKRGGEVDSAVLKNNIGSQVPYE